MRKLKPQSPTIGIDVPNVGEVMYGLLIIIQVMAGNNIIYITYKFIFR